MDLEQLLSSVAFLKARLGELPHEKSLLSYQDWWEREDTAISEAVDTAKWAMEVHGGLGALAEYPVERWLREAMILAVWEGTSHRQMLDGLEAMVRKGAHRLLLAHLVPHADPARPAALERSLEALLGLPPTEREAAVEPLFRELARFTGEALAQRGFGV